MATGIHPKATGTCTPQPAGFQFPHHCVQCGLVHLQTRAHTMEPLVLWPKAARNAIELGG